MPCISYSGNVFQTHTKGVHVLQSNDAPTVGVNRFSLL